MPIKSFKFQSVANGGNDYILLPPDKDLLIKKISVAIPTYSNWVIILYETEGAAYSNAKTALCSLTQYNQSHTFLTPVQMRNLALQFYNGSGGAQEPWINLELIRPQNYIRDHEGM